MSFFCRYDSSIQAIGVPITVAPANVANNNNKDREKWRAHVLTCESKFASVMPFGVTLGLRGNLIYRICFDADRILMVSSSLLSTLPR
jgi:hypothetical protein